MTAGTRLHAARRSAARYALAIACALTLNACALPRMIDSEVESFASPAGAVRGASFRFEQLPSQQAQAAAHATVEQMAQAALERAGLVRNETQARYSVQVEVSVLPLAPGFGRWSLSPRPFVTGESSLFYPPLMLIAEPPWYSHRVHFLMRDLQGNQIAFESTASFDGPWSDSATLLPVVMDAALRDYPNASRGPHKVVIELPAKPREAR